MKFKNKINFTYFILLSLLIIINCSRQFDNTGDLKADFTWIEIDNPTLPNDPNIGFTLEKNTISIEPYVVKLIFTPLQKYHFLKMSEIVIFNNFEIMFDMNLLTKNIFGILDQQRFNKVQKVLDNLKIRLGQNSENCRFIFNNNIENMSGINISTTSVNTLSQMENINPYISLIMNVFCFNTIDNAINFNSNLMKMYNNFIESANSSHLFYFNKQKMNNLKVIYRNMKVNQNSNIASVTNQNEYGLNQQNSFNSISNVNIHYAYLIFSKDGVLFSDGPNNNIKNVMYSFQYDSIKECQVEMTDKKIVLPNQMLLGETSKCCIKLKIDVKDVFDNLLNICSYKTSLYQCNLEAKYIQEMLGNKCQKKLVFNIQYAFDNGYNIKDYILSFNSFTLEFVFRKVYEFIVSKLKMTKLLTQEKQIVIESKLTRMIQDLGQEFQNFLKENSMMDLGEVMSNAKAAMMINQMSGNTLVKVNTNLKQSILNANMANIMQGNPIMMPIPIPSVQPINLPLPTQSIIKDNPILKSNIFKLCENHPKMKQCICAAFPLSTICKKDFCLSHPNYYECSPSYCMTHGDDFEACKCKFTPFDTECKCRLNPIRKECYCIKFPQSVYCLPDFCKQINNANEIYCTCKKNPYAPECKPSYCHDNKHDGRCKCLIKPDDKDCVCKINPGGKNCGPNGEIRIEDDYEEGVGFMKKYHTEEDEEETNDQKIISKKHLKQSNLIEYESINSQIICKEEDIFCLCRNHPHYKQCVCLANPSAEICQNNFCVNSLNKNSYECDPKNNCKDPNNLSSDLCRCKSVFDDRCRCKLIPLHKSCFCEKYKISNLCNFQNCNFDKSSLFCNCIKPNENKECNANYCINNPTDKRCKCILNPMNDFCKCLNDPTECSKFEIMNSINSFKKDVDVENSSSNENGDNKRINSSNSLQENQNNNSKTKICKMETPKSNSENYSNMIKNKSGNSDEEKKYILMLYNKQLLFNKSMQKQMENKEN